MGNCDSKKVANKYHFRNVHETRLGNWLVKLGGGMTLTESSQIVKDHEDWIYKCYNEMTGKDLSEELFQFKQQNDLSNR